VSVDSQADAAQSARPVSNKAKINPVRTIIFGINPGLIGAENEKTRGRPRVFSKKNG
jgi:hypothetical protein